jgi:hypothetical protein
MQRPHQRRAGILAKPRLGRGVAVQHLAQFIGGEAGGRIFAHQHLQLAAQPRLAPAVGLGDQPQPQRNQQKDKAGPAQNIAQAQVIGGKAQTKADRSPGQKPGQPVREAARRGHHRPNFLVRPDHPETSARGFDPRGQ